MPLGEGWGVGHGVSTGSGSDRVTLRQWSSPESDPVATAPGTDFIVLSPHPRRFLQGEEGDLFPLCP